MSAPSGRDESKWFHSNKLLLLIVILMLAPGLCCMSYLYEPFNILYLFVFGRHYYEAAIDAIPEYDELNDELMTKVPVYPGAILVPGKETRTGPGADTLPIAPGGPRFLSVWYVSNNGPIGKVLDFYKSELEKDGWKLARTRGRAPVHYTWIFTKAEACIEVGHWPGEAEIYPDYTVSYEVSVYYDLNVLLGFPGVPDGGCP